MNCIRCGAEMNSTTGGNHTCSKCSMEVNDLVYRPQNCDMPLPQDFGKKEGWICPVCGRGVAPWMSFCPCQGDWKITYGRGTGGDVDLSEYQDMMDRIQKTLEEGEIKL